MVCLISIGGMYLGQMYTELVNQKSFLLPSLVQHLRIYLHILSSSGIYCLSQKLVVYLIMKISTQLWGFDYEIPNKDTLLLCPEV